MLASDFFTLPEKEIFQSFDPGMEPWEWIPLIRSTLAALGQASNAVREKPANLHIGENVWIHPTVKLPAYGCIEGPAWIDEGCELRPGVFVRANVIVGPHCVLGNSCEFKNCLLAEAVQVPHFNYVGDSILGRKAHLGAGAICSNLRFDHGEVVVRAPDRSYPTGLRKLGALIGDEAEAGCNVVLQPGTLLGKGSAVSPGIAFGGCLGAREVVAWKPNYRIIPRR